jgi:hypothetical protein
MRYFEMTPIETRHIQLEDANGLPLGFFDDSEPPHSPVYVNTI